MYFFSPINKCIYIELGIQECFLCFIRRKNTKLFIPKQATTKIIYFMSLLYFSYIVLYMLGIQKQHSLFNFIINWLIDMFISLAYFWKTFLASPWPTWLVLPMVFRTGPDQEVGPWKPETGMKTDFLSLKNRIFC